jgi:hypothetical protein
MGRKIPIAAVTVVLAGLVAAVALGATSAGHVYDSGTQCVYNFTAQGSSYNSVTVRSLTDRPPWHFPAQICGYRNPKPDGYLAGRWESFKWGTNVNAWVLCGTQGWNYGGGYELNVGRGTTGCGGGYYFVRGGSYVYNGGWLGGWLATDYEWLW